ncbi:hypothetical protein PL75_01775 [Neisseria arctica]|uniref:Uncharacterized protein n=1 Tax=Neisseria arctica TaxID=1470200 RepID=A0A0J0YUC2_9NEIS|nr:hypothetical protein [Neisseria arctica]KLT73699.1 hypothetical protein PL75_01775 [Neisseria arctica]UOO85834.1 hypothetical protein LVJ86_06200 [Neisseria arctica]
MLNRKLSVVLFVLALASENPAMAMTGGTSQSVPVNDQDVISNTKQISEYLRQLNQFFGAGESNALKNSSGLGLSEAMSSITGSSFGKYETDSRNITLNSDFAGAHINSSAVQMFYGTNGSAACNQISIQNDLMAKAKSKVSSTVKNAVSKVFGVSSYEAFEEDSDPEIRMAQVCNSARNILAMQLYDIRNAMTVLERRNTALQSYLTENYSDSGQLQKRQYQIGVMQALIQNDMARLQAALAAYDTKAKYYNQIFAESSHTLIYGKRAEKNSLSSATQAVQKIENISGGGVSSLAGMAAGAAVATGLESDAGSNILDKILQAVSRVYDELKEKLGVS